MKKLLMNLFRLKRYWSVDGAYVFNILSGEAKMYSSVGDLGFKSCYENYKLKKFPGETRVTEISKKKSWHPYQSVAAWYHWQRLKLKTNRDAIMIYYSKLEIPEINRTFMIAKNEYGICSIEFISNEKKFKRILSDRFNDAIKYSPAKLKSEVKQINEYFSGKRKTFKMKLYLHGTEFQKKVWSAIAEVKYGKTASYDWLSNRIKNPGALEQ